MREKYYKLHNGKLIAEKPTIVTNKAVYCNPDEKTLRRLGFKPLVDEKPEFDPDTQCLEHIGFDETSTEIVKLYEVRDILDEEVDI